MGFNWFYKWISDQKLTWFWPEVESLFVVKVAVYSPCLFYYLEDAINMQSTENQVDRGKLQKMLNQDLFAITEKYKAKRGQNNIIIKVTSISKLNMQKIYSSWLILVGSKDSTPSAFAGTHKEKCNASPCTS